jgi:hypothetical protein
LQFVSKSTAWWRPKSIPRRLRPFWMRHILCCWEPPTTWRKSPSVSDSPW